VGHGIRPDRAAWFHPKVSARELLRYIAGILLLTVATTFIPLAHGARQLDRNEQ
jgi:hypothetical protein